ncbi:MAG: UMP kinase [Pseudomonadota bacterium]
MAEPLYRRALIKLSGEALMGEGAYGIDVPTVARIAEDVRAAHATGVELCLVIGGGNIFRGIAGAAAGMERGTADYMGMLATVMNALAFHGALQQAGVEARVLSAIPMQTVCEAFTRPRAQRHLAKGRVVIFAGGTGNPYFTTDTAAALRAAEMGCDALIKATQVDGIYSADPKTDPKAERYESLTFDEVLTRNLKVMDAAAIALARDNHIPIVVTRLDDPGNLARVLRGEARATVVG